MARYSRLEVLNTIVDSGLVPVFYHKDVEVAKKIVAACVAGGARVVEFTNRGDFAPHVFTELSQWMVKNYSKVILGVGSVVDAPTAAMYIASGTNFVVGPLLNPEVARLCNRRKIPYSPGCGSATEIAQAEELGVEIVKVFPGESVGGPDFVRSILGPCPWTRIMPTGGVDVTRESIGAWFKAGVAAVGIGSNLIQKGLVEVGKYDEIAAKAAQLLLWIREVRGGSVFEGVEHVGLYPFGGASAQAIAEWYAQMFGFKIKEGNAGFFVEGSGPGRIDISKEGATDRCHIAIKVYDFEAAVVALEAKGIEFEEPKIMADAKAVFMKQTDPAGNIVHLVWKR